jgi:serine/threonine protein kinase
MRGTTGFRAPELIVVEDDEQGNPKPGEFSRKSDMWSLGCILYELVTKERIFFTDLKTRFFAMGAEAEEFLDALDEEFHPLLLRETFCPVERQEMSFLSQIRSIISSCLSSKPLDRPTAMQLKVRFEEIREYLISGLTEEEMTGWTPV